MTKKEALKPAPLLCMLEQIMDGRGLFMDSKDWRELKYAYHVDWLKPMIDAGYIRQTKVHQAWPDGVPEGSKRRQFNYHDYEVTPKGMAWWATERVREYEHEHGEIDVSILSETVEWGGYGGMEYRSSRVEWKGIGGVVSEGFPPRIAALVKGIRDGLFEFHCHHNGHPAFWRMNERLECKLTRKGYEYFSAIPRLELECA